MDYTLSFRTQEPCDLYITSQNGSLYAVVVESRTAYAVLLGLSNSQNFCSCCSKNSFTDNTISITVCEDLVLADGIACYEKELPLVGKEVLDEVSCS